MTKKLLSGRPVRIYLDLHDVIAGYMLRLISLYGWPRYPKAWTLPQMFPNVDWVRHFSEPHHSEFLRQLDPLDGAIKGVFDLQKAGLVRILTATKPGGLSEESTRWWVDMYLGSVLVIYLGSAVGKAAWLKRGILKYNMRAVVVDDHPVVLSQLLPVAGRIPVVRFAAPWNDYPELDSLPTARNWDELVPLVEGLVWNMR